MVTAPEMMMSDYHNMRLDALCDIIEQRHHTYLRHGLAEIETNLSTLLEQTPNENPFMKRVLRKFRSMADEMAMHTQREESILFPYIRKIEAMITENVRPTSKHSFLAEQNVLMEREHRRVKSVFTDIRGYTSDYRMDDSFSELHLDVLKLLKAFESDYRNHSHIEDHILFPKAINLEAQLNDNH